MKSKILSIVLIIGCCFNFLHAEESKDVAIILKSKGSAKIRTANPDKWLEAQRGMRLNSGDIVKTGSDALVAIMFTDDKSLLKIRENSTVAIKGKREKSSISKRLKFALGQIWVKVQKQQSDFLVETPSGTAVVKGTEFYQVVDQDGNTTVIGLEGLIQLKNKLGEILVRAGETGLASKLTAPTSQKTDGADVPNWGGAEDSENYLEFEFQDAEGNKKSLKINYQSN